MSLAPEGLAGLVASGCGRNARPERAHAQVQADPGGYGNRGGAKVATAGGGGAPAASGAWGSTSSRGGFSRHRRQAKSAAAGKSEGGRDRVEEGRWRAGSSGVTGGGLGNGAPVATLCSLLRSKVESRAHPTEHTTKAEAI